MNSVQKGSLNSTHPGSVKAGSEAGDPFRARLPSEGPSSAPQSPPGALYLNRQPEKTDHRSRVAVPPAYTVRAGGGGEGGVWGWAWGTGSGV